MMFGMTTALGIVFLLAMCGLAIYLGLSGAHFHAKLEPAPTLRPVLPQRPWRPIRFTEAPDSPILIECLGCRRIVGEVDDPRKAEPLWKLHAATQEHERMSA